MTKFNFRKKSALNGQSLIEILIGLTIAAVVITVASFGVAFLLRSNTQNQKMQTSSALRQELADKVKSVADADWNSIYNLSPKGTNAPYSVVASGTVLTVVSGAQTINANGVNYSVFFYVENVSRDNNGNIVATGGIDDPSTQKITSYAQWSQGGSSAQVSAVDYLTRWKNEVFNQNDWSGGAGQEGPLTSPTNQYATSSNVNASTSIRIQGL